MTSKFIKYFFAVNIFGLAVACIFLFYLMIAFPSMLVPYDDGVYKITEYHASPDELKILSRRLANWVRFSKDCLIMLSQLIFCSLSLLLIVFAANLIFIQKMKKHLSDEESRQKIRTSDREE